MRKRQRKKLERRRLAGRFQALAKYVMAKLPDADLRQRWAKTMWVLFHADFEAYRWQGGSITGLVWTKGREHPEPRFP